MIIETDGDLFDAETDAWVNPVNCVGVMGAGLALEFKHRFPAMMPSYQQVCRQGQLVPGKIHCWRTGEEYPQWVLNFPTKVHWNQHSRLEYIQDGLDELARLADALPLRSVAIPALGCGLGGLDWLDVRAEVYQRLPGSLSVLLFPPPTRSGRKSR